MLKFNDVRFQYPSGPRFEFPDFSCQQGEHLLLLGESGKGKTTLLHLLAGLLKPNEGSISLKSQDMCSMSGRDLDKFRGENIGIVFQTAHFVKSLNVIDNLILPQYLTGVPIDRKKALDVLDRLNLNNKAYKKTTNLSIGEQQRVAIARALINDPKLILADEPTSALDDKNSTEVISLLEQQASISGSALIIVTHDQRLKEKFETRIEL